MIDTKALREKILDLAIRGKLVPQDPNDEPASVLLERIRAQKQQMVKEGKLKAKDIKNDTIIFKGEDNLHYEQFRDGTVKCIEDEIPFEIPESWEWCRFLSGFIINPRNSIQDNIEVSFIPMPLMQEGYTNNHKSEIRLWKKVKTGYTHFAENDIAIAKITPCFENKKSVVFKNLSNGYGAGTTELHIIRTLENTVLPEYVLWYIKRDDFISDGINAFSGAVGQKRIGREFIEQYLIPLPPVSEQEKILEAIHTAFMSIDSIECSYTKLNALITIAKSKILDLAIRGKLVPQDPNDEPASVLLERIKAEKEELIKQGKIKRDKKESVIFKGEDNSYYQDLPENWALCSILNIAEVELGKTLDKKKNTGKLYPYLRSINVKWNDIDLSDLNQMRFESEEIERYTVHKNDLLICEGGDVGRCCVWQGKPILYQNALHRVRFYGSCNSYFFMYTLMWLENMGYLKSISNGVTIKHLTKNVLSAIRFPLPPLVEQNRIVEAIETAFAQLDEIANSIA